MASMKNALFVSMYFVMMILFSSCPQEPHGSGLGVTTACNSTGAKSYLCSNDDEGGSGGTSPAAFSVIFTTGANIASISLTSPQVVSSGSTLSLTVTPAATYHIAAGGTCPGATFTGNVYTTGAITSPCSIAFTAVAGGGTQAFATTPTPGYVTASGGTCAAGSWSGSNYTTGTVSSNCTVVFTNSASVILFYSIGASTGGATEGRTTTDNFCGFAKPANLYCPNHISILAYSGGGAGFGGDDDVSPANMSTTYSLPVSFPVNTVTNTGGFNSIADNWADLLTRDTEVSTNLDTNLPAQVYWTGFDNTGAVSSDGNCGNWANGSDTGGITTTVASSDTGEWSYAGLGCGAGRYTLCACWNPAL